MFIFNSRQVRYNGKDIPKSPFPVKVEGFAGDASKVTASGPGLEPEGVIVQRPTYFDIFTKDAGKGVPEVIILDPAGNRNSVPVKLRQISPDVWRAEYAAPIVGVYSINVFFAGQPIPKSPFGVRVSPLSDARKVRASGRGLQPNGVRVRDDADFRVYTEGAGEGNLDIRVIGPGLLLTQSNVEMDAHPSTCAPQGESTSQFSCARSMPTPPKLFIVRVRKVATSS